jgi:low-density lipoprotein receptor-related protein 1 (alpha-2-macroglobulin receptor)
MEMFVREKHPSLLDKFVSTEFLTGTNTSVILESNLGWPNALAIDYATRQLFFGDAREDFIGSVNFDGSSLRIVLSRGSNPTAHLQVSML